MSIHEIEKQIVIKIISHYQNFDKAVLGITGYTLAEVTGFSFPLQYFKDNLVLNLPPNISISDDIKILLNAMFKEGKKTNKGTLTIYPNGEYESSFIWDEEVYLQKLKQTIEGWFILILREASYRVEDRCIALEIPWNFETQVTISFTKSIPNPVLFTTPNQTALTFSLYLEQMYYYIENDYTEAFEAFSKEREQYLRDGIQGPDEKNYFLMNEGELKGYYPRWNTASFMLKPNQPLSFEDIKFEWREENA